MGLEGNKLVFYNVVGLFPAGAGNSGAKDRSLYYEDEGLCLQAELRREREHQLLLGSPA